MLPMLQMFAGYNAWANERVYNAVAVLPDVEYRADHGAFFGSVHGRSTISSSRIAFGCSA